MKLINWDEIQHFNADEFECKCGCRLNNMQSAFVKKLDSIRAQCGFPFYVTSGYRCRDRMQQIGSPTSSHGLGLAADIAIKNAQQRLYVVDFALSHLVRRIGIYPTFVHLDTDSAKNAALWWGEL